VLELGAAVKIAFMAGGQLDKSRLIWRQMSPSAANPLLKLNERPPDMALTDRKSDEENEGDGFKLQYWRPTEMMRTMTFSVGLGALIATQAMAHDDGTTESARQLGLAVGKTYTCLPEAERPEARADFEEMFDIILYADGNEIAFVFAVAIGYGAASEKTEADCTELLEHVNAVKAEMRLGGMN
jgi:hypothetical protein